MEYILFDAIILTEANSLDRIRPLGAYTIAHSLREEGYNVLVIDMYSQIETDILKKLLRLSISNKTKFVGYSGSIFVTRQLKDFHGNGSKKSFLPRGISHFTEINSFIKQLNKNIKLIYGGSSATNLTYLAKQCSSNFGIDYVFYGYSDFMIKEFMSRLCNGQSQKFSNSVHGMKIIDYDYTSSVIPFSKNNHKWHESDCVMPNEPLPLEIARGCIFRCKFCSYPLLGKNKNDNSYIRTEESILSEILDNYEKYKTTTYAVVDDTFNERNDKIEMLLRVRDRSKIDLNFGGYIRLDLVRRKPEQLPLLVNLNFKAMFFGIESMHYPSAKSIGKGIPTHEIKETLHDLNRAFDGKAMMTAGFIIGLPHETKETLSEWADWVISKDCPLILPQFYALSLGKTSHSESELFKNPEKYGYRKVSDGIWAWENDNFTGKECLELAKIYNERVLDNHTGGAASFQAVAFTKYGYDFNDMYKVKVSYDDMENMNRKFLYQYYAKLFEYIKKISLV